MALSRLPASSTFWLANVGGPAIDTNMINLTNAVVDALNNCFDHGNLPVTVTSGSPDGAFTVTFSHPFASAPEIVATNTSSANRDYGVQILSKTTALGAWTGFTGRVHHWDGTNAGSTISVNVDWFACSL